jgi:NADH-quinone oxidoreductase subunit J
MIIHTLFSIVLLSSAVLVILGGNPIFSVISLIICFFSASFILIIFKAEFLSIIFFIIYMGAIAVLFLFIVMMLNIKYQQIDNLKFNFFTSIFVCLIFHTFCYLYFQNYYYYNESFLFSLSFFSNFDSLVSTIFFGQILFNYYTLNVFLIGFTLLIALIGTIVLTHNFFSRPKKEINFRQLSRSKTFLSFFS